MTLAEIEAALSLSGLEVLGGFHPDPGEFDDFQTILLLGPAGEAFWPVFSLSTEYQSGTANPLDRWSERVVEEAATSLNARAIFPFGGPPHHPFYSWALRTGRFWASPIQLLVHDRLGLMVSFRGALGFGHRIALPPTESSPCARCHAPCLSACPVDAFDGSSYDVTRCKAHLGKPEGTVCMQGGCLARRACPVGKDLIPAEQSALSMRAFL